MATYSKSELDKLRSTSPVNFRLILLNCLLIGGCAFIIFESVKRYNQSLDDLDRVARLAAAGNAPCGLAVPRTKFLLQSLKEISDDPFTEEREDIFVNRVRGAFCGASSVTNALRSALQTTEIPEACCNDLAPSGSNAPPAPPAIDLNQAVKDYLCKCDTEGCSNSDWYGDFLRRIAISYVQSAPAFARYVDSGTAGGGRCTNSYDPWAESVCTDASARATLDSELSLAATNSMNILSGGSDSFPEVADMLYRLMALSVVEFHDRNDNSGQCFKNTQATTDPVQFCQEMLATSVNSNGRPVGTQSVNGCIDPAQQRYYVERIGYADACTWTQATGTEGERLKLEPDARSLRRFTEAYRTAAPVYAICSSMLEFGLLDRRRLFGIPDVVGKFDWYGENHGNSFTRWIAGWGYYGLFDANVGKVVAEKHTAYLDLKLHVGYRLAMTSAWTIAAVTAAGYLLAFSLVPTVKLLYVRFVRSNLTNVETKPIVLKPPGTTEFVALGTCLLVGLWVVFVDPASYAPYVVEASCADYDLHGGPFATTESRPRDGLVGLVLIVIPSFLLVYLWACRRKPLKDQVMPLQPFPLWPIISLILLILISVLILAIRAGDDWWQSESTDVSSSNTKRTSDFEEIIGAAFWSLLLLGGLMGTLGQRHMAANAVLSVPRGQLPTFAMIWIGMGVAVSVAAAVLLWPLYDCQLQWEVNEFVCGDGTEVNIRWNYFWGCIAWGASVLGIVFVVFASYRTLFRVPRKNDISALAFNKSKEQKVAQLAAKRNAKIDEVARSRFGLVPPGGSTNPFGTGATAAMGAVDANGVVSASFVVGVGVESGDDGEGSEGGVGGGSGGRGGRGGVQQPLLGLKPQSVPIGGPVARV